MTAASTASANENSESTFRILRRFYDLITAGEFETIMSECFHPDIVVEMPSFLPHAGIHRGLNAFVTQVLPKGAELIDFGSIVVDHIMVAGDWGVATVDIKIIDSDDHVLIAEHWGVRDGKLAWLRVYAHDPAPYQARMARMVRMQAR